MFSLVEHIEYLMMSHDCVVVPGWGALIAQYSSSFYNAAEHVIESPKREVGFNAAVAHNDGLLAQSIMRRHNFTYDQAMRFIADSVTVYRQQLAMGQEVSFGRLGYFHSNAEGNAQFMPFFHEMHNDEYFGLRSVSFRPLDEQEETQESAGAVVGNRSQFMRRLVRAAASIVVLLGLTVVLTTPIATSDDQHYAGLNVPTVKHAAAATSQVTEPLAEPETTTTTAATVATDEGRYFLVISTLSNEKQVAGFKAAHPTMASSMKVQKRGKIYRVYVARSDNRDSLLDARKQLPAEFSDAWVTVD